MNQGPRLAEAPAVYRLVARVFLPFAGGYFLSYFFRNVNALIAPQLVSELNLSAADLGLLTAAYFLTFGAFQIPLGLLLDRFGPRRVQSCLLLAAATGAMVFGSGESAFSLAIGRGLIGLGVAGGLMSAFMAFVLWFPRRRLPLVNGFYMAFGGLGALAATEPLEVVLAATHWRSVFFAGGAVTAVIAAVIFVAVPERERKTAAPTLAKQLDGLKEIYSSRLFWRLAPLTASTLGTGFAVTGLWAGPWLRDIAGLGRDGVASHLFVSAVGLVVGSALSGILVEGFRLIGVGILGVVGLMATIFMIAQVAMILEITAASYFILGAYGFMINAITLTYPALSQRFPVEYAGRVVTALNLLVIIAAFSYQYLMGWILGLWPTTATGGYSGEAYKVAFISVLVLEVLAFVHFLRPTSWR
jgi:MFS family permease